MSPLWMIAKRKLGSAFELEGEERWEESFEVKKDAAVVESGR